MPENKTTESAGPEGPGEVLDLASAAEFLKVSKPTFYRWLAQEKIKGFKAGTQWRFYRKDLEQFLESGEPQQQSEVEGLAEVVDAARAERGQPAIDWTAEEGEEAPQIARLVHTLLTDAIDVAASDIHIGVDRHEVVVRYRVDGVLHEAIRLPKYAHAPLLSRLKLMCDMELTERRLPQDGRVHITHQGKAYDLRTTTLPTVFGEAMVLRILDQSSILLGLDRLGLSESARATLERKIREPWGLMVFTGPTGAGRTTTVYSALSLIAAPHLKIVTIEDPVEYQLRGLDQVHVNRRAGLTFPAGVRFIMRCDPDIVMVGETRDLDTAELTMQAALTGHLVLTTLLPLDAVGTITRYLEMGVEPFLVASALSTVVSQRLVRKLCPSCREKHSPPKDLLRGAGMKSADIASGTFFRAKGCPDCRQTGYKGRTALFEVLEMNEKLRDLTSRRASTSELRAAAAEAGMVTMMQDGLDKVRQGITSFDEVMRVTASGQGAGESAAQA